MSKITIIKSQKYYQNFIKKSVAFLQKEAQKRGAQNLVLGLSGGIDSAIVAALCHKASKQSKLGVFCLSMPSSSSSKDSLTHAKKLAKKFDLPLQILPLENYQKAFLDSHKITAQKDSTKQNLATQKLTTQNISRQKLARQNIDSQKLNPQNPVSQDFASQDFAWQNPTPLEMGNFCARLRMALLYDYSSRKKALVIGTSNKSELMLGYGTIFGDLACAINPIGSLYKSEIFVLAKMLKIPKSIIAKPPSADLYAGQSDEGELGFCYAKIDIALEAICKKYGDFRQVENFTNIDLKKIKNLRDTQGNLIPKEAIKMAKKRISQNLFKRSLPKIFIP